MKERHRNHTIKNLWSLFKGVKSVHKSIFAVLLLLTLVLFYESTYPLVYNYGLKEINQKRFHNLIYYAIPFVVIGTILSSIFWLIADSILSKIAVEISNVLRFTILDTALHMNYGERQRYNQARIFSLYAENVNYIEFTVNRVIAREFFYFLLFAVSLVMIFFIDWRLALICTFLYFISILVSRFYSKRSIELRHKKSTSLHDVNLLANENIEMSETLRIYNMIEKSLNKLRSALLEATGIQYLCNLSLTRVGRVNVVFSRLIDMITLTLGTVLYIFGMMELTLLITFLLINNNIRKSIDSISVSLPRVIEMAALYDQIHEFIKLCEHPQEAIAHEKVEKIDQITFKDVYFKYEAEYVLKNINFSIHKGEFVGIVGKSGSGKSTLLRLLTKELVPNKGEILINGKIIEKYTDSDYYNRISAVFQKPMLFNMSVLENIRLGNLRSSYHKIVKITKEVDLFETIEKLSNGLHSNAKIKGRELFSAGQIQRINIARALSKDPDILILDEITSSLDPANRFLINEIIGKFIHQKTIVLVSHTLFETVKADKIITLENGEICQMGSHEQLVNIEGVYKNIWEKQQAVTFNKEGRIEWFNIHWLKRIPLLQLFSDKDLHELTHEFVLENIEEGDEICVEGHYGNKFYIILMGSVAVLRRDINGIEKQICLLDDGDFFGEAALIGKNIRNATVRAHTGSTLLSLDQEQFNKLVSHLSPESKKFFDEVVRSRTMDTMV